MKTKIIKLTVILVILVIATAVCLTLFLDTIVKKGVETVGPQLTRTEIKLDSVKLSLLSGKGEISGLLVGNPEGYQSPAAITLGKASLVLSPGSLLSDKIVIRSIRAEAPEITIEGGFKDNNLTKILENVQSAAGDPPTKPGTKPDSKPEKAEAGQTKLQVDEFVLTGVKLHVSLTSLGGMKMTLPLPTIELRDLGQGKDGITVAELVAKVLDGITTSSVKAVGQSAGDVGKLTTDVLKGVGSGATDSLKNVGTGTADGVQEAVKGIGGLFKKKD
jgi:hypothetical protein